MPGIEGPGIKGPGIIGPGIKGPGIIGGAGGGGGGDPFFANVRALLHLDGTDGSIVFTDVKGHAFTQTGPGVALSTVAPKFGSASAKFTNADFIQAISNPDFNLPLQFTIETWIKFDVITGNSRPVFRVRHNNGGIIFIDLYIASGGVLYLGHPTGNEPGPTPAINTWYHMAVTRDAAGTLTCWVNGVVGMAANDPTLPTGNCSVSVGNAFGALVGNMDDFRYTVGVCRYTAPFAPPTAPFPNS
jgi:hypothetical protein